MLLIQRTLRGLSHDAHDRLIEVDLRDGDDLGKRRMMDDPLRSGFAEGVGSKVDDVTIVDGFPRGSDGGEFDRFRRWRCIGDGQAFQEMQMWLFVLADRLCLRGRLSGRSSCS